MARTTNEALDQFGHFWMGFGARLTYLDYLLWRREAKKQYPPGEELWLVKDEPLYAIFPDEDKALEYAQSHDLKSKRVSRITQLDRVDDMLTDMRWYVIGATCAEPVRWLLVGLTIMKYA